jgi:hypothetical protein
MLKLDMIYYCFLSLSTLPCLSCQFLQFALSAECTFTEVQCSQFRILTSLHLQVLFSDVNAYEVTDWFLLNTFVFGLVPYIFWLNRHSWLGSLCCRWTLVPMRSIAFAVSQICYHENFRLTFQGSNCMDLSCPNFVVCHLDVREFSF